MERLLCIKIASKGDLLLAGPAFRLLRKRRPGVSITLLVGESCVDMARHLPFFDEIRTLDDHALMGSGWLSRLKEALHFYRVLKACKPAEVYIFHRDWRYNFFARAAGIPARKGIRRSGGNGFLTHPYFAGVHEHHASQYMGMVLAGEMDHEVELMDALKGVWQFAEGEREQALLTAAKHGFEAGKGRWVALGFGGGHNVKTRTNLKTWPLDHYRRLASHLAGRGYSMVWVGGKEDAVILGDRFEGINLAGKLGIAETAAVLSACEKAVANDTLILHLAGAIGTPVIGLFGPTDPSHYQPLGMRSTYLWMGDRLGCGPCHRDGYFPPCRHDHRCMTEITVEMVARKIEEGL